jgi:hypothetical protein
MSIFDRSLRIIIVSGDRKYKKLHRKRRDSRNKILGKSFEYLIG